jgi:hypothetical protein
MIRLTCPNCERKLSVDESKAGAIGACPGCGHKIKIPGGPPARGKASAGASTPPPSKKSAPQAEKPVPQPPVAPVKSPEESWRRVDNTPYAFQKEPEPAQAPELQKRRGRPGKGEPGGIDYGPDRGYERRKRGKEKKSKEPELAEGVTYFKALLIASLLGWAVGAIYAFMMPGTIIVISCLLFGLAICVTGFMWFLFIALKGGNVWVGKPLLITFLGISIMGTVFGIAFLTGVVGATSTNPAPPAPATANSGGRN